MSETKVPQVLTDDEVAESLRIDIGTVHDLLERGELRGAKLGGEWRVRREDVKNVFDCTGVNEGVVSEARELLEGSRQKIPSSNLLFWAVLSSLLGSVLWAITIVVFWAWENEYAEVFSSAYSLFLVASSLLLFVGLLGFRAARATGCGRLGRVGFFLAFYGLGLSILAFLPPIAMQTISGGNNDQDLPEAIYALVSVGVLGLCAHFLGMILLGIATLRARRLAGRWRAVPLVCA